MISPSLWIFLVTGDEVIQGKPAPAPYLLALERCGCRAERAVAIEDSIQGARSAVAAGLATIMVSEPPDRLVDSAYIASDLPDVIRLLFGDTA